MNLRILNKKLLPLVHKKAADKVGVVYLGSVTHVSRFAGSEVHQHLSDEDTTVYIRVLSEGRMGLASTNSLEEGNLEEAFNTALDIARLKLDTKEKNDIPSFKPLRNSSSCFFPETSGLSAEKRISLLRGIFKEAKKSNLEFSGNLHNGESAFAAISPQGVINYHRYSQAGIKLIATNKISSGYAAAAGYRITDLDPEKTAKTAITKCLLGNNTAALTPGHYDVILEAPAVAELLAWMNYIGFGARSVAEETSFLYKKMGKKITGEKVTIYDDGSEKRSFLLPFDFEGKKREKIYLIKKGIAGKPLCDSYYAKVLKMEPNGHASLPDDPEGPLGLNLVMENGNTPENHMITSAKRAILITRLHYINGFLDTHRALMTGMTRDGTFLVENGRIKCAVKNMRFTESILEAFSRIRYISKERKLIAEPLESLGSCYVPAIYIKDFCFTS